MSYFLESRVKANTVPIRVNHIRDKIVRDYKKGMTIDAMAERYGSTVNSITVTICKLRKEGRLPLSDRCTQKN